MIRVSLAAQPVIDALVDIAKSLQLKQRPVVNMWCKVLSVFVLEISDVHSMLLHNSLLSGLPDRLPLEFHDRRHLRRTIMLVGADGS